ncbi:MAG: amidase [Polymorphobacter sp.]|uniref:amidase n=1 Tax=Polymorphobacter sp. TaxID=1909290 RepID=UPI003A86A68E
MTDLLQQDATAQAEAIATGKVSPSELLEAAVARADALNPSLNFIAQDLRDMARARAHLPFSGPFAGVPFLVKDLHMPIAGQRSGEGSRLFDGHVATENAVLYDRYCAAGLNTFGKTTTPEFGLTVTTESKAYGLTRNPWNPAHSSGGSSGGAAVAVSAGVVAMAHASDGGGSIRCPASACGLFGLKPSRGRMPAGPHATEGWMGFSLNHAVTRSVRDSAALLDATHGMEPGSRYTAPPPGAGFLAATRSAPGRLRIALQREAITGVPVHPDVLAALDAAARLLESLGHTVEEAAPALPAEAMGEAFVAIIAAHVAHDVRTRLAELGRDSAGEDIELVTQMFAHIGNTTPASAIAGANQLFQQVAITVSQFMSGHDILLSPVFAQPPIELGRIDLSPSDIESWTGNVLGYSPFTALANQTGCPAMSLPLGTSRTGLPIGIMAMGRYGEEALLFSLAAQIEQAAPWAGRRPPLP